MRNIDLRVSTRAAICLLLAAVLLFGSTVGSALISLSPTTTGLSMFDNSGNPVTAVVAVKASGGGLYGYYIGNANTTTCYLQIFNVASGSVSLGSTVPNLTFPIPPQNATNGNGGANLALSIPITFSTAISLASTTTAAGGTTTGCGMTVNIWYE